MFLSLISLFLWTNINIYTVITMETLKHHEKLPCCYGNPFLHVEIDSATNNFQGILILQLYFASFSCITCKTIVL